MVSSNKLICATEEPKIAGIISVRILLTPLWPRFIFGIGISPSLISEGNCSSNCTTPAIATPQASAISGSSKYGARK